MWARCTAVLRRQELDPLGGEAVPSLLPSGSRAPLARVTWCPQRSQFIPATSSSQRFDSAPGTPPTLESSNLPDATSGNNAERSGSSQRRLEADRARYQAAYVDSGQPRKDVESEDAPTRTGTNAAPAIRT